MRPLGLLRLSWGRHRYQDRRWPTRMLHIAAFCETTGGKQAWTMQRTSYSSLQAHRTQLVGASSAISRWAVDRYLRCKWATMDWCLRTALVVFRCALQADVKVKARKRLAEWNLLLAPEFPCLMIKPRRQSQRKGYPRGRLCKCCHHQRHNASGTAMPCSRQMRLKARKVTVSAITSCKMLLTKSNQDAQDSSSSRDLLAIVPWTKGSSDSTNATSLDWARTAMTKKETTKMIIRRQMRFNTPKIIILRIKHNSQQETPVKIKIKL